MAEPAARTGVSLRLRLGPAGARSLRERAARALREAIVAGSLAPGTRLVEEDLSQQLKISRGPIREALRQLEQEGLVVSFPYRATEVLGVSEEEVHQVLIPIRLTLERFSFPRALRVMTDRDLAALARVVAEMGKAAAAGDLQRVVETDIRFHKTVLERSGQPHALQIWLSIEPRIRAYFQRHSRYQDLRQIEADHKELVEAMGERDEHRLLGLLDRHIDVVWRPER